MRTGRTCPIVTLVIMSTLMPLPGIAWTAAAQVPPPVETIDQLTLRDVQQQTMTATDGTPFAITRAIVSVPEVRGAGEPSGSMALAVVCARRADAAVARRGAHIALAGGPGDSGVNLVLNLVRQVNAIETERYDPSLPLAFKIARLFGRTLEEIFQDG